MSHIQFSVVLLLFLEFIMHNTLMIHLKIKVELLKLRLIQKMLLKLESQNEFV